MVTTRIAIAAGVSLSLGCGPGLLSDSGDVDGTQGDPTGSTGAVVTTTGGVVDEGGDLGSAPVPDEGPLDEGPQDGSDDIDVDDGPPPVAECWRVDDLFAAPAEYPVQVADQDGDGTFEIWVFENLDNGPGPGTTTVYSLDAAGETTSVTTPGGRVFAMVDGDGNGFVDLLTASFGGGGPVLGFLPSDGFGSFGDTAVPFAIEFGDPFVGFFDATGDGVTDVLQFSDSNVVELQVGTGDGGMVMGKGAAFADAAFVVARDVASVPGWITLQPTQDFMPGPGGGGATECASGPVSIFDAASGALEPVASQPEGSTTMGALLGSSADGQVLYVDVCDLAAQTRGLATLTIDNFELQQTTVYEAVSWSTVGDFDGDGVIDTLWAADADSPALYQRGLGDGTFGRVSRTAVAPALVDPGRWFPADLDGDGRQALVRAVFTDPDDPSVLQYQSLTLSECPV